MAQRVLGLGARALPPVSLAALAHRGTAQTVQPSSPTSLLSEERDDGFVEVFQQPVQQQEVAAALDNLLGGGGALVARRPPGSLLHSASRPHIEEIDAASDTTSEDSAANHLMASVDELNPFFAAGAQLGEDLQDVAATTSLDLLAASVTNVLNDPHVVGTISRVLVADPAFRELMMRVNPALPPTALPLLLEELVADSDSESSEGSEIATGNPIMDLLVAVQRGVLLAAGKMGEVFVGLGHFLRGLGTDLNRTIAGMDGQPGATTGGAAAERPAQHFQRAVIKVACAVAVLVLTRRIALARMVL